MSKKQEKIIWIVFCCLVFAGLFVFFVIYRPVTIFDTDDWTYLNFTRNHNLLPSTDEWNPAKILPENIFPLSGYLGKWILMPITGDFYTSVTSSSSAILCIFVFLYIMLCTKVITLKFDLQLPDRIILTLFLLFMCFISHLSGNKHYGHLFHCGSANLTFNYTIPGLLNVILICLSIIHEDQLRSLFNKKYWLCKAIYLILIYFAVFSNLYSSIVFVSFAASKILQYLFIDIRDYSTDTIDKLIQCFVYIYALILWFISMFFEISGGRAAMVSSYAEFNLAASFRHLFNTIIHMNILFIMIITIAVIGFIVTFIHVILNKSKYLNPLHNMIKRKSQKSYTKDKELSSSLDTYVFRYTNLSTLMIICALLNIAFLVLLAAKTGAGYLSYASVQYDYCSFFLFIVLLFIALLIKYKPVIRYVIIACTIAMICMITISPGTYSYYYYSSEQCKKLCDYIITQYKEADDKHISEQAQIHVPAFSSSDNFPIAVTYGQQRIGMTLTNYGITHGYIDAVLVPDETINKEIGIK